MEKAILPALLGYEAAGVIDAIGAEQAIVPAYAVVTRPPGIGLVAASGIWMPYPTAWGGLIDIGQVGKGDAVVITAASSSVGLAVIQTKLIE